MLQYLMGGLAEIDVDDWKRNTEYNNYLVTDQPIVWFWKVPVLIVELLDVPYIATLCIAIHARTHTEPVHTPNC